jgi:hypothetical protein
MKIKIYQLFFIVFAYVAPTYGMMFFKPPIVQKPSIAHDALRTKLESDDVADNQPHYTIVGSQKRGICADFAFNHILQTTEPLKTAGASSWFTELNIMYYFKQIKKPRKGCLALYTLQEDDFDPKHAAVVSKVNEDTIQVLSKWGVEDFIVEHNLFTAPMCYGRAVFFFVLEEKYVNDKQGVVQQLQKDIAQSIDMKELLARCQNDFNRLAAGKKPVSIEFPVDNLTYAEMAMILLKKIIGIDINGVNEHDEAPLISALKRGDVKMVQLCIEHDADKNVCDMWGTTIMDLAQQKGDPDIMQVLRQKRIKRL